MSLWSVLRGAIAQVLPGGGTYGSYNPPRRRRPEDQPQFNAPRISVAPVQQNQNPGAPVQMPTPLRPENLFQGLHQSLNIGQPHTPSVAVNNTIDTTPAPILHPGTIVQPHGTIVNNHFVPDAPKPQDNSVWGKFKRGASTVGKTAVGTVANVPEVGLAALRAGTGIVQGVTQIPHAATAGYATITQKANQAVPGRITHALNTGAQTVNTGVKRVTTVVNKPVDAINRGLDRAATGYERVVPVAAGGANVYRREQIPLNILAALATGGASAGAEGASTAGRVEEAGNFLTRFLNKPLTSENIVSRTGRAVNTRTAPVVRVTTNPISSARSGITRLINTRRLPTAEGEFIDAGEAGTVLSDAGNTTQIPVGTGIDVNAPPSIPQNVPVRVTPRPTGPPIRELGGDTPGAVRMPTPEEVTAQRVRAAFDSQAPGRSDQAIEGITPRSPAGPFKLNDTAVKGSQEDVINQYAAMLKDMGEGNGTQLVPDGQGGYIRTSNNFRTGENAGKRMTKQDWIDQAEAELRSGRAEPGLQQAFDEANNPDIQSMLDNGPAPAQGTPITVRPVTSIPVQDRSVVPTDLPEAPGQVRPTTQVSPNDVKTEAAASAPIVARPAALPAETQAVLDNPKNFTKRQVAAARNQLKLAKKMAKTQEDTAAALDRIDSAKPTSDRGFVPTGEFTTGRRGNITEVTHRSSEAAKGAHDTANLSAQEVLTQAREEVNNNGVVSPESIRNLKALRDSGKFSRTSQEFKDINREYNDAISHHARALSMTDRTARTSASGEQLANRFTSKLLAFAEDTGRVTDAHIARVTAAENTFTDARDAAVAAGERFKQTGSQGDFEAWKAAQKAAEEADRKARITEYLVSKEVLKGNKSLEASKAVQEAEKNAGVYSMDSIDANMLSGTGTMVRNFVNTLFPRVENKLFGRISTRVVKPIATVGGSSGRGERIGAKIGGEMYKADIAARKEAGVGIVRRTVTAGNTVGERNIEATAYSKAFDHYKQLLRKEGYKGKELSNRAEYNVRTDPDGLVAQYQKDALQANALSSLTHTKKIENVLADGIQRKFAEAGFGSKGQAAGRFGAKAVTRVGLGFPTVIAKSLAEGFKRATLGIPEVAWSTVKFLKTGNREALAQELAKSIQHAGSGAAMITIGHALGKMGVISGAYPSDPKERERWTAEGRQENSINIGGQWFNIPGYLGGFALPLMLGATTATGNIKDEASLKNAWDTVLAASPVDSIQSTLDIMTGNGSDAKVKNAATSLARAATPAGSFVAELAKLTDSTKNDTTTKDTLHNILDSIAGGIPGLNNKVNKIDKLDAYGNPIHNPNRVATILGAQGSTQQKGTKDVKADQTAADSTYQELQKLGVTQNKKLMQLVDPKLAKQMTDGQPLKPEDVKKIQAAVTKGITATDDSNWRESGDYETDKAAMQVKLQMLNADPTTKPSEKEQYEVQIKRDQVLHDNKVPYDVLKMYQSTSVSDWREMGNPENDNYDPDTYQMLWSIDELLTKAGGSYRKGDFTKQKYSQAQSKKRGYAGARDGMLPASTLSTDFGQLKAGEFTPKVQSYQTIDQQTGSVPVINTVRPNIVHKIGSSG